MRAPISAEADISGNLHISFDKEIPLSFKKMYLLSKIKYIYISSIPKQEGLFFLVDMKCFRDDFCALNIAAKIVVLRESSIWIMSRHWQKQYPFLIGPENTHNSTKRARQIDPAPF